MSEMGELVTLSEHGFDLVHEDLKRIDALARQLRRHAQRLVGEAPEIAQGMLELAIDLEARHARVLGGLGRRDVTKQTDASASAE